MLVHSWIMRLVTLPFSYLLVLLFCDHFDLNLHLLFFVVTRCGRYSESEGPLCFTKVSFFTLNFSDEILETLPHSVPLPAIEHVLFWFS